MSRRESSKRNSAERPQTVAPVQVLLLGMGFPMHVHPRHMILDFTISVTPCPMDPRRVLPEQLGRVQQTRKSLEHIGGAFGVALMARTAKAPHALIDIRVGHVRGKMTGN